MKRILLVILVISSSANASFFDERYRGWLWFEENKKSEIVKITPENAKLIIENLKEELDDKRNVMIAQPNAQNVINYIIWEEKMWKNALKLDEAYREAKFLYPEYFDKRNYPTNVHAVKLKRQVDRKEAMAKIKGFAAKFDLVFFFKEDCLYSKSFAPILKDFCIEYSFKLDEVSVNGGDDLAKKLNIKVTPVIYAISKDKKSTFEIIRGFVSKSELEEYVLLAINYSNT